MDTEKQISSQERLEKFLQAVEEARQLQDDWIKYGLDAAYLYVEDVDGDWLEKWGEDDDDLEVETNSQQPEEKIEDNQPIELSQKLEALSPKQHLHEIERGASCIEKILAAEDRVVGEK